MPDLKEQVENPSEAVNPPGGRFAPGGRQETSKVVIKLSGAGQ